VSKKQEPAPSLDEASSHLGGRIEGIEAQIAKCDQELAQYKQQLARARGVAANAVKQKALQVLKRKKMYEQQRDSLLGTQMNIDQCSFMTEQAKTTAVTVAAMKEANTSLKKQYKKMDIDDIERVADDMQDLMMDQEEINEIMSRSYAIPGGVDEADLDAELAALEDDIAFQDEQVAAGPGAVPSYLPSVPTAPTDPLDANQATAVGPSAVQMQR